MCAVSLGAAREKHRQARFEIHHTMQQQQRTIPTRNYYLEFTEHQADRLYERVEHSIRQEHIAAQHRRIYGKKK